MYKLKSFAEKRVLLTFYKRFYKSYNLSHLNVYL